MKINRWIIIVIVVVLLCVGGFFIFRSFSRVESSSAIADGLQVEELSRGDISASVGSTGNVLSSQSAELVWQLNGTVGSVLVNVGDLVESGQTLAELDEESLPQTIIQARAELISYQQQLDDLYEQADLQLAQAKLDVIQLENRLEDLQEDREQLDYKRCDQDTIDMYYDEYTNAVDRVAELEDMYDGNNASVREMLINARDVRDIALANYEYCISNHEASEIEEADIEIANVSAQLELAQQKVETLSNGEPDPDQVALLEARIDSIEAILKDTNLETPFSGTISEVYCQEGDMVFSGNQAFRLDDLSQLYVEVEISEVDINKVEIGQDAVLSFDAVYGQEYYGEVTRIASVGKNNQGLIEFTVRIAINEVDESIKPGMTATAVIYVDHKEDVLRIPNQAVRIVDGKKVVYIISDEVQTTDENSDESSTSGGSMRDQMMSFMGNQAVYQNLKAVEVVLGSNSGIYSELLEGDLQAGDQIVLNPPSAAFDLSRLQQNSSVSGD